LSVVDRIAKQDLSLFDAVESQTTTNDRRSLLALHAGIAESRRFFTYLEIGSYLGGTLQPFVADPRCIQIISIDPRPRYVPDARPGLEHWDYGDNSAARMLDGLARIPDADLGKIRLVERSTEDIAPGALPRADFCFIDGEHTKKAALRDGRFCRVLIQGAGVIAFHDFSIVEPAVVTLLQETKSPMSAYMLKDSLFVLELGCDASLLMDQRIQAQLRGPASVWRVASKLRCVAPLLRSHRKLRERQASLSRYAVDRAR
jgi:hypothetical protein